MILGYAAAVPSSGANTPEEDGSGALDDFQALLQELCVSMPELDVVVGSGSCPESYRLADDESHGLGFGLTHLLRGQSAAFTAMQQLVRDLMHGSRKLFGRLHP
jgi:hypothetical protein